MSAILAGQGDNAQHNKIRSAIASGHPLPGRDQAEQNADRWFWSCGTIAVKALAATGRSFSVDDIRRLGVPDPDSHQRWGALLAAGMRTGLIEATGATISATGRPVLTWRGLGGDE